jgi:maleylacetoacetate isomerase/maleylpyruvate isomerase
MEKTLQLPEEKRNAWLSNWTLEALKAIEGHVAKEKQTGKFCHGDSPTMADICLCGQVVAATAYFKCDVSSVPTAMRIYEECMKIEAFSKPHPMKQPGAQAH